MPERPNLLLGYGERLAVPLEVATGGEFQTRPYGFREARDRLLPMFRSVVGEMDSLPEVVCPQDETVASLTLHPEYRARRRFPPGFLRAAGLRVVGSRPRQVRTDKRSPNRRGRRRDPDEATTTQLFVAGKRSAFRRLAEEAPEWKGNAAAAAALAAIESFSAFPIGERLRSLPDDEAPHPLEIVLHASARPQDRHVVAGFQEYIEGMGLESDFRRAFFVGGLCFLSLETDALRAREVARYSFLRVLRSMPALRPFSSPLRSAVPAP